MNMNMSKKRWLIAGLLATGIAIAGVVSINLGSSEYQNRSSIHGVTESDIGEVRGAAMSQAVGVYRLSHGLASISSGQTVSFRYPSGRTESGLVRDPNMSDSTSPLGNFGGNCDFLPCRTTPPSNQL